MKMLLVSVVSVIGIGIAYGQEPPGGGGGGAGIGVIIPCEDYQGYNPGDPCPIGCTCPDGRQVDLCDYSTDGPFTVCACPEIEDPVAELCGDEVGWCRGWTDADGCFVTEECSDGSLHITCPDGWYVRAHIDRVKGTVVTEHYDNDPDTPDGMSFCKPLGGTGECTIWTTEDTCLNTNCAGQCRNKYCHASSDDEECEIPICMLTTVCDDGRTVPWCHLEPVHDDECNVTDMACVCDDDPCDENCPPYFRCPGGTLVPWCKKVDGSLDEPEDPEGPGGGGGGGGCSCNSNPEALCPQPDGGECTVIDDVPFKITKPGCYRLGKDFYLTECQEDDGGIVVRGAGATIYMNGHVLVGGCGHGISCEGGLCQANRVIGPGIIADWSGDGVHFEGPGNLVSGVSVIRNDGNGFWIEDGVAEDIIAKRNACGGVVLNGTIQNCQASGGTYGFAQDGGRMADNTTKETEFALVVGDNTTVTGNTASSSFVGLSVIGCESSIQENRSSECDIGCTVFGGGNFFAKNTMQGSTNFAGIVLEGTGNRVGPWNDMGSSWSNFWTYSTSSGRTASSGVVQIDSVEDANVPDLNGAKALLSKPERPAKPATRFIDRIPD